MDGGLGSRIRISQRLSLPRTGFGASARSSNILLHRTRWHVGRSGIRFSHRGEHDLTRPALLDNEGLCFQWRHLARPQHGHAQNVGWGEQRYGRFLHEGRESYCLRRNPRTVYVRCDCDTHPLLCLHTGRGNNAHVSGDCFRLVDDPHHRRRDPTRLAHQRQYQPEHLAYCGWGVDHSPGRMAVSVHPAMTIIARASR
ncbi:MAG: hypothetical protein JWN49_214 [Parcubacteria group bacterium]|nr:hypothetical protein [Parcubacteria group bacterium]